MSIAWCQLFSAWMLIKFMTIEKPQIEAITMKIRPLPSMSNEPVPKEVVSKKAKAQAPPPMIKFYQK